MLSSAAPVLTAGPQRPVPPPRDRTGVLVVVLGALAALCAVAFPFAPVTQPQVTYSWRAGDGSAAIPLMPYQPVALTVTTSCDAVRAGGTLLSTVVSNVPAVMLLVPLVEHPMGGVVLALVSTLAGNLLIVGSIANIIVAGAAARRGIRIDWRQHARVGIPVTLATLAISAA